MRYLALVAVLCFAPAALADKDTRTGDVSNDNRVSVEAPGGSARIGGDDVFAVGLPEAPNREVTYGEVAQECQRNPGSQLCELGIDVLEARYTRAHLFVTKWVCWPPVFRWVC